MSMQSPRDLREWQRAVERNMAAAKSGSRLAIAHADRKNTEVKEEFDNFKLLTPAAPVELVYQSATYVNASKRRRGKVTVDFPDVVFSTNGTAIGVYGYEIAGQDQGVTPLEKFQIMGTSSESSLTVADLNPGSVWKFKVRAKSGSTVKAGLWSPETQVTVVSDSTPPPAPSTPVVETSGGYMKVKWDGLGAGNVAMPSDFDRLEVAFAMTSSPTTVIDTLYTAGFVIVPKVSYSTTHYFRFRAIDSSGNISAWSAQATGIPAPLVDADVILAHIDAAETQIVNIGRESIRSGEILTTHLADNAVSQVKLQDQIISLAKMDTSANAKIQKGIDDAFAAKQDALTADGKAGTAQTAADKAAAQVQAIVTSGPSLIFNGNFDRPITSPVEGWPTRVLTYVEADARSRSGANLLRAAPTATTAYAYSDTIDASPERSYVAEMYVRLGAALVDSTSAATVGVFFTRTTVGGTVTAVSVPSSVAVTALSQTTWTRVSVSYTLPSGSDVTHMRFGPRLTGNGNTYLIDDFKVVDMTDAKAALDAAAAAQTKADTAFTDAQAALTNAGLAQTSANGKNANYYTASAPAGTGHKVDDVWFRSSDNRVHRWSGSAWVSIADTAIATAQSAANSAASAASTADGKAVAAQSKADQATIDAANARTAGDNAAAAAATADAKAVAAQTKANKAESDAAAAAASASTAGDTAKAMVNISTSPAPAALAAAPGAIWQQVDANNTDRVIEQWVAGNDRTWTIRKLQDSVFGSINAVKITAGTMSAARIDAADLRARVISAGKITAADIVSSTLTSASGVFGTMDASVINAGTLNAARLNAGDIRAKFLTAGLITAGDIVTGTLTSASGVFGTIDANIINAGTLNAARLNAGDVRAKFLAAGLITAVDMVTGTITANSGIIGSLDIGKVTTGSMSGSFITAKSIRTDHLLVTDPTNFAPSPAESPEDWGLTDGMAIVTSGLGTTGKRFDVAMTAAQAGDARAYGPFKSVKPDEPLWASATVYRGSGSARLYLRWMFYDKDRTYHSYKDVGNTNTAGTGAKLEGTVTVSSSTTVAYARLTLLVVADPAATSTSGFYEVTGYRQNTSVLIADGAVGADKVTANAISTRHIVVGDFANLALGSDFDDAAKVPWTLHTNHTRSTGQKKSGTHSLALAAAASASESVFTADTSGVKEGEQWYVKAWAYIDAAFNGSAGGSKIRVGNQAGAFIAAAEFATQAKSSWQMIETVATIPAGATSLQVTINSDHTTGTAYLDDIQIRRISEASLIQNLGVEKLTASAAAIGTAVIDKLWTDVVRSRKITTDMLIVGRGVNGLADEFFLDATVKTYRGTLAGNWGSWGTSGGTSLNTYGSATLTAGTQRSFFWDALAPTYGKDHYIPVEPGQKWLLSALYTSTGGGVRATVRQLTRAGVGAYTSNGWTKRDGTGNTYAGAGGVLTLERIYTVPADVTHIMPAVQFEAGCTEAYVYGGTTFTNMTTASLLVDGAVTARNLTVTEELWAKVIKFKKLAGDEIDANALNADTGWIGTLRGGILINDVVDTGVIKADAITSKHTITGALIQTSATANTGIKLSSSTLRAYGAGGVETFTITAATGAVQGVGQWRTGTGGNHINVNANANGGIIHFLTGAGSGRGSIWARDNAGSPRMSLAYSNLDEPSGTLPVVAVTPTEAYLNYGSRTIKTWNNAGVEELLIDATGAAVVLRGNLDMRDGRIQLRYGSAIPLGYLGQAPASGASPDMEIRADAGFLRLVGLIKTLSTYNSTTTLGSNVVVSASGDLMRSTSASRYKVDQREMAVAPSILSVKMKDWIDKAELARKEELEAKPRPFLESDAQQYASLELGRVPGLIAEDVEAAGGRDFVIYGKDGQTEGVMYERFAHARIQALHDELLALTARVRELEGAAPS